MMLKHDEYVHFESNQILMSDYIAERLDRDIKKLPFADYFKVNPILVPIPNSSFNKSGTLWVPQRLSHALVRKGLGKSVVECLSRVTSLPKSATSLAENRPKAISHYDSLEVEKALFEPDEILLVDDVVTRGATLLGAANKLADAYPNACIRAFAAIRTISNPLDFVKFIDPCKGTITLSGDNTFRVP
jgi:predicted amidophosphoribosyltransferase